MILLFLLQVQILTKGSDGDNGDGLEGVAKSKFNELVQELEEQKELAANRLAEIELLQKKNQDKIRECESLRIEVRPIFLNCLFTFSQMHGNSTKSDLKSHGLVQL